MDVLINDWNFGGKFHVICLKAENGSVFTIKNETRSINGRSNINDQLEIMSNTIKQGILEQEKLWKLTLKRVSRTENLIYLKED
jgi:hypothetical protein